MHYLKNVAMACSNFMMDLAVNMQLVSLKTHLYYVLSENDFVFRDKLEPGGIFSVILLKTCAFELSKVLFVPIFLRVLCLFG